MFLHYKNIKQRRTRAEVLERSPIFLGRKNLRKKIATLLFEHNLVQIGAHIF